MKYPPAIYNTENRENVTVIMRNRMMDVGSVYNNKDFSFDQIHKKMYFTKCSARMYFLQRADRLSDWQPFL